MEETNMTRTCQVPRSARQRAAVRRFLVSVVALTISLASGTGQDGAAWASPQDDPQPAAARGSDLAENLVQRLESLARLASVAGSPTEYSAIVEQCQQILATEPATAEHIRYLKSLMAWALNRRARTRMELADRFAEIGNHQQADQVRQSALDDLDTALANDDTKWQARRNRAELLTILERYEAALADWDRLVAIRAGTADGLSACFNRAELLAFIGRHEEALTAYRAVLAEKGDDLQATNGCGNCLLALGKADEAIEQYNAILQQQPENAGALANRAEAWQRLKRWDLARDDYRASIASDASGRTYQRLAWLLATCPDDQVADPAAALDAATIAISLDGETATHLDTMAAALAASGQFDKARDMQTRAISMSETEDGSFKVRQTMYENNEPYRQDGTGDR
jgi:tetratricopeptide (TPR) repeat protein